MPHAPLRQRQRRGQRLIAGDGPLPLLPLLLLLLLLRAAGGGRCATPGRGAEEGRVRLELIKHADHVVVALRRGVRDSMGGAGARRGTGAARPRPAAS